MAVVHNLLITSFTDASSLLGQKVAESHGYAADVGFMADSLAALLAACRGLDYDEHIESLLDQVELSHAENDEGDEFASIISPDVVKEIAAIDESDLASIASEWAGYEEDLRHHVRCTPLQMLRLLIKFARLAVKDRGHLAVHSLE